MRPDLNELDEEIRGHIALSIRERIERGEDPEAARLAALKEFGNVLLTRDSIRRVWRHRWFDEAEALARDIRFGLRSFVSQSVAQRLFPSGDAVNRRLWRVTRGEPQPRRIIGIVADVDDENVVQEPSLTVYLPYRQLGLPSRLFVRAAGDPYALVPSVTRTIRQISADQGVERPTTLEDVRAEVLTPERLNAFVFSAFGGIALLIAVVGVAGVLAFSVSARTREFGIRMAIGSTPSQLLTRVLKEGTAIVTAGITAGAVFGYVLASVASTYLGTARMPGLLPALGAAAVLIGAAVIASLVPAARASRVDVLQALRSE